MTIDPPIDNPTVETVPTIDSDETERKKKLLKKSKEKKWNKLEWTYGLMVAGAILLAIVFPPIICVYVYVYVKVLPGYVCRHPTGQLNK